MANDKLAWFLVLFVVIFAFFVFLRQPLTGPAPQEMIDKAAELESVSVDKLDLVRNTYFFVNDSYTSPFKGYLKEPGKVGIKSIQAAWDARGGYVPSNTQNGMVKQMLLLSDDFVESDFSVRNDWCKFSPHSVLFVDVDEDTTVAIDIWSADHGGGFNCFTTTPCGEEQIVCLD